MGQIISHPGKMVLALIGSFVLFRILQETRNNRIKKIRQNSSKPVQSRRETKLWMALMYLTRGGQQIRIVYENGAEFCMSRHLMSWNPQLPPLQWHDALVDAADYRRTKIVAISRDCCGSRRTIMTEFFPVAIADLILSYMYPALVKGRHWKRKQT